MVHAGGETSLYYTLTDLTGDGLSDIVLTLDTCEDVTIGKDHWLVFPMECGDAG